MANYYLHTEAINVDNCNILIDGISKLQDIYTERTDADIFMKHNDIWDLPALISLYESNSQFIGAVLKCIESINSVTFQCSTDEEIDSIFPNRSNAFLGINFSKVPNVHIDRQITDIAKFRLFKSTNTPSVSIADIWNRRDIQFPKLVFCDSVKPQFDALTNISQFNRVIKILDEVNSYIDGRRDRSLGCSTMIHDGSFKMSRESEPTMQQYSEERTFKLPNGKYLTFEYHLKVGDKRIYIAQVDNENKLYVGYIGKHLRTVRFN